MPREQDQSNIRDREGDPVECKNVGGNYSSKCLICHNPVVIHCGDCGVQITGCRCTLRERAKRELRR